LLGHISIAWDVGLFFYGLVPHAEHSVNVQCCVSCVPKYYWTIYSWSAFRISCLLDVSM